MGLFDYRLFNWLQPRRPQMATSGSNGRKRTNHREAARALAGGRATLNTAEDTIGGQMFSITAPGDAEAFWRVNELDTKTLDRVSPAKLLELLADVSPEVSAGLWNFLRLCNPGWEATALGADGETQDTRAQAALDAFLGSLPGMYDASTEVPADTVINILFTGAFMRGGLFAELVLDENGRLPLNIATPDPYSARFKKVKDPVLGQVYQLGQWQGGQWVALDRPTVRYVPIDPLPGSPYGRATVAPALFTSLFLIGILHDLRRVIMQQGWPRLDLEVGLETLADNIPDDLEPDEWKQWVNDIIEEVETVYAALEPDDAYVHTDVVKVNRPVGTLGIGGGGLQVIDQLISRIERMAARGLKMMPLLLGIDDATSDANANRQWEIQAAGIKSIQHLAENLLEKLLTLALQCQGIQATVRFRFAELRAAEMLRDAQTEAMRISNATAKYNQGWTSQDQASEEVTGSPADVPEPRVTAGGALGLIGDDGDGNERAGLLAEIRAARLAVETAVSQEVTLHFVEGVNQRLMETRMHLDKLNGHKVTK